MKRFSVFLVLLGFLCFCLWGCNLLENFDDAENINPGVQNFSSAEQQQIVGNLLSLDANLSIPVKVPRMSFYRFDLTNENGANRAATIFSYNQVSGATASATYGPETTAKVYLYEAKKKQVGYDFDYFTFEQGLSNEVINNVVKAMLPYLTDPTFLLKSDKNLDEAPEVAAAISQEIIKLPNPVQANFTAVVVDPGNLVLELWPRFQSLGNEALLKLVFNSDMQQLVSRYQNLDLNNFPLLKSNVSMENLALRPVLNSLKNNNEAKTANDCMQAILALKTLSNQYTISYDGNGNTAGDVPSPQVFSLGCSSNNYVYLHSNTGELTKEGFLWDGWTASPSATFGINYGETYMIVQRQNYVLSAIWKPAYYTVTYNGNGNTSGSIPVDSSSPYSAGATVTVLGNTGNLLRTGFTFGGWNTAANGEGTDRAAGSTFPISFTNHVLYAKWIAAAKPTVTITSTNVNNAGFSQVDPTNFEVTFSSAVTGFSAEDITITGPGSVGNFVQVDPSHYTFSIQNLTFYTNCKIDIGADVVDNPGNEAAAAFNFQLTH